MRIQLTQIQHGSTSDGPGLRATVFFAGCGLRCGWCHNPETWTATPSLLCYSQRCANCGVCARVCPSGAMRMKDGQHLFDRTRCLACGSCATLCPTGAVALSCREYALFEVMDELTRDRDFFAQSGGGVTLSGGEPLLQPDAALALADACREQGFTTLLDTAGDVSESIWQSALPHFDMVYLDAKCWDEPSCRTLTGGDFARISANTAFACRNHPDVTIRVPVIPGANAEHLPEIGAFLRSCGAQRVCLLPFHRLGSGKYRALGLEYPYADVPPLPREQLAHSADTLRGFGFEVSAEL